MQVQQCCYRKLKGANSNRRKLCSVSSFRRICQTFQSEVVIQEPIPTKFHFSLVVITCLAKKRVWFCFPDWFSGWGCETHGNGFRMGIRERAPPSGQLGSFFASWPWTCKLSVAIEAKGHVQWHFQKSFLKKRWNPSRAKFSHFVQDLGPCKVVLKEGKFETGSAVKKLHRCPKGRDVGEDQCVLGPLPQLYLGEKVDAYFCKGPVG